MNDRSGAALPGVPMATWAGTRPALTPENELVYQAWAFCEGWKPERFALAAAFYGIDDLDFLAEQMMAMRDTVSAHQAAQLAAVRASQGRR